IFTSALVSERRNPSKALTRNAAAPELGTIADGVQTKEDCGPKSQLAELKSEPLIINVPSNTASILKVRASPSTSRASEALNTVANGTVKLPETGVSSIG